jgi:SAM-dependent methyltransferase
MTRKADRPAYFDELDPAGTKASDAAKLILDTTRPFRKAPDHECTVLDAGCGYGYTAAALAAVCKHVIAVEPSPALHQKAESVIVQSGRKNIELRFGGIDDVTERRAFDLVILDNVLEHIPDQPRALATVAAAMKPGGALYLLVPNKVWPIEAHYHLPFLSYLPLRWANRYLRLTRRGTDYTDASYAPTYGRLQKLLRDAGLAATFVVPRDLSLTIAGAPLYYRVGAAVLKAAPWAWRFAKGFLAVATLRTS